MRFEPLQPAIQGIARRSRLAQPQPARIRTVEKLPKVHEDGTTNVPGVYVVGDLTGIPLLKFSSDTGAKAVARMLADPSFRANRTGEWENRR